ncbi:Aldo/keto reductase [Myriangium duriaei CBS 260.36]|uniref:Aldo/keto reductase n=1 Tax=Myriangium duriaei CBS 260.36 TaxID=1168546 RepID=A0A9P4MNJ2_9PEZI|nr:Aldo/keto reductase [Myriangium duriaei CBS 260.36]
MATILGKHMQPTGYGLMGLSTRKHAGGDPSMECMAEAYKQGVDLWNGGEFYGSPEHNSLHLLNQYFTEHPEQADKVIISIKGGNKPGTREFDGGAENIRRSIDECLRVLDGKKFLDIYEAARVDPKLPIEHTIETIAEYVKVGKIGGISLSECSAESIRRAAKVHKIQCVEVEFSLWATEILHNGVASTCAELGIPIIAYSPLGRGFLTGDIKSPDDLPEGDFRKISPRFQPGAFEKNLELVKKVEKIAEKKGVKPGQIGMAWVIKQSNKPGLPTIIPIPGSSSPARIKENITYPTLTDDEEAEINKIVESADIVGDRYPAAIAHLNFGDSPPLKK